MNVLLGLQDPLICEGFQKLLVLGITRMCFHAHESNGKMMWVATILAATVVFILFAQPYGSRSRNDLAAASYAALCGTATMILWVDKMKAFVYIPCLLLGVFFIHLQLMPGDIILQTYWLHKKMKEALGCIKQEKLEDPSSSKSSEHLEKQEVPFPLDLETREHRFSFMSCPAWCSWLVDKYREVVLIVRWQQRSFLASLYRFKHQNA